MTALVLHAPQDLRLEPRPPGEPGPGEVLVQMEAGGICGSDLHYYNHGGFGSVRLREPMILGHEVAGRVLALGPDTAGPAPGTRVAISPSRPCGACRFCRTGQPNHCLHMRFYGSAMPFPHVQGAFRQQLVAQAGQCVPAEGLTAGEAAMAEPLAVCLHALHQAGDLLGARVLVTGCGPIGCLSVLAARRAGAAEILATDLTGFTLDMARAVGADIVLNTRETPDALSPWAADKGQVDVLLECSGAAAALAAGLTVLRPGGVAVQVGMSGDMAVPMQQVTVKELTLRGTFRFHAEFATAVALMQKRLIDVRPLITATYPLGEAAAAFAAANDRTRSMKVQIGF